MGNGARVAITDSAIRSSSGLAYVFNSASLRFFAKFDVAITIDVRAVVILANGRTTRNPAGAEVMDPYMNLNHNHRLTLL
jgi:hypothetical protein